MFCLYYRRTWESEIIPKRIILFQILIQELKKAMAWVSLSSMGLMLRVGMECGEFLLLHNIVQKGMPMVVVHS